MSGSTAGGELEEQTRGVLLRVLWAAGSPGGLIGAGWSGPLLLRSEPGEQRGWL